MSVKMGCMSVKEGCMSGKGNAYQKKGMCVTKRGMNVRKRGACEEAVINYSTSNNEDPNARMFILKSVITRRLFLEAKRAKLKS